MPDVQGGPWLKLGEANLKRRIEARVGAVPLSKEQHPDNQQHGHHHGQGEMHDIPQETRRADLLVISDRLDHEIRSIANVSIGPEKNGPHTDGHDVAVKAGVAQEKGGLDLFKIYG